MSYDTNAGLDHVSCPSGCECPSHTGRLKHPSCCCGINNSSRADSAASRSDWRRRHMHLRHRAADSEWSAARRCPQVAVAASSVVTRSLGELSAVGGRIWRCTAARCPLNQPSARARRCACGFRRSPLMKENSLEVLPSIAIAVPAIRNRSSVSGAHHYIGHQLKTAGVGI